MPKTLMLPAAALLIFSAMSSTAYAQRIDSRAPGSALPQNGQPRPYSAPANATVTRQVAIGGVQSRIGSDGQIMKDPRSAPSAPAETRLSKEPQLMQALGPEANLASAPVVQPAASAEPAAEPTVPRRNVRTAARRRPVRR